MMREDDLRKATDFRHIAVCRQPSIGVVIEDVDEISEDDVENGKDDTRGYTGDEGNDVE